MISTFPNNPRNTRHSVSRRSEIEEELQPSISSPELPAAPAYAPGDTSVEEPLGWRTMAWLEPGKYGGFGAGKMEHEVSESEKNHGF